MSPARTPVALILATAASVSLVVLVAAAVWRDTDLAPNYVATINSTLGVLIGSICTWVGGTINNRPAKRPPAGGPSSTPAEPAQPFRPGGQQ